MVKCYFVLRRKPGLSKEAFHAHWKSVHAPLVARLPGLVKYTQHHVVSIPRPGYQQVDDEIDGIVETWWASEEAMQKAAASPELLAVVQDELNFMAHSNHNVHSLFVTESVDVVSPRAS